MSLSRFKSLAFLGSAFTAAALLVSTAAFAASSPARTASSAQSARASAELRSAMTAQLRFNHSGTVINSNQISYDHGNVVVTVVVPGVTPAATCPGGTFCMWTKTNLTGTMASVKSPVGSPILRSAYISVVHSVHNLRSTGSIIQENRTSGPAACYPGGVRSNDVSNPVSLYDWLYLEKTNNC